MPHPHQKLPPGVRGYQRPPAPPPASQADRLQLRSLFSSRRFTILVCQYRVALFPAMRAAAFQRAAAVA
eukprot:7137536-Prymnesium_polylepis.1